MGILFLSSYSFAQGQRVFECTKHIKDTTHRYFLKMDDNNLFSLYHNNLLANGDQVTTLFAGQMQCQAELGIDCVYFDMLFLKFYPEGSYQTDRPSIDKEHLLRFGQINNIDEPSKDILHVKFKAGECIIHE